MMRQVWFAAVITLLGSITATRGQEAERFTIRLVDPKQGSQSSLDLSARTRVAVEKHNTQGQLVNEDLQVLTCHLGQDDWILEQTAAGSRSRRHFRKFAMTYNGETQKEPVPIEGARVLIIEKNGRREILTEKGEPLEANLRATLERAAGQHEKHSVSFQDFAPAQPVRVGETWTIPDAAKIVQRDDAEIQLTRATAQLQKVYRKEGRLFGVIETRVEAVVKSIRAQGRRMELKPGSRIQSKGVLDACIDGTSAARTETGLFLANFLIEMETPDGLRTKMDQSWEVSTRQVRR